MRVLLKESLSGMRIFLKLKLGSISFTIIGGRVVDVDGKEDGSLSIKGRLEPRCAVGGGLSIFSVEYGLGNKERWISERQTKKEKKKREKKRLVGKIKTVWRERGARYGQREYDRFGEGRGVGAQTESLRR